MTAGKETLLVCFLGDPAAGSADLPRVILEMADGRIEEVALSAASRRLIRLLSLPREMSLSGLSKRGSGNRLAESLAAPPPQRRVSEVKERLDRSRSQTDRMRRALRLELESQRLGKHLHLPRGWIGLRDGTSDVALLFAAVRDERWDLASRLLAIVAPEDPLAARLLADEDWSLEARAHIADALAQAKENFQPVVIAGPSERRLLPAPSPGANTAEEEEVLEGEIVDDPATTIALAGPRAVTPWAGRRRRLRATTLMAVLLLLAVGTAAVGRALLEPDPPPSPLELSIKRAGPWSTSAFSFPYQSGALANLTREISFGAPMVARTGDTLLAALRLNVTRDSRYRDQPFEITTSTDPSSAVEAGWSASFSGPSMPTGNGSGNVTILGLTPRNRIRLVPDSTVLLDDHMRTIRRLPDMRVDGDHEKPYRLPHLRPGRIYYVAWRLEVVRAPDSAAGQISRTAALYCFHPGREDEINVEAKLGDVLQCQVNLTNWGPETLRAVRLHFAIRPAQSERQRRLWAWAVAPAAEPRVAKLTPGILNINPFWPASGLEYLPGSNQLEARSGSFLSKPPGNPTEDGILVAALEPGLAQTQRASFKVRLISSEGGTRSSDGKFVSSG